MRDRGLGAESASGPLRPLSGPGSCSASCSPSPRPGRSADGLPSRSPKSREECRASCPAQGLVDGLLDCLPEPWRDCRASSAGDCFLSRSVRSSVEASLKCPMSGSPRSLSHAGARSSGPGAMACTEPTWLRTRGLADAYSRKQGLAPEVLRDVAEDVPGTGFQGPRGKGSSEERDGAGLTGSNGSL
jgi:hypothetical protein